MKEIRTQDTSSKMRLVEVINKHVSDRHLENALIENIPTSTLLEKIIMNYIPTPASNIPGEFKSISIHQIRRLKKQRPNAIIVGVYFHTKIGMPLSIQRKVRDGIITREEFTRKYIERLMLPDAQEEITRLKKLRESNDIYITSFEQEEGGSLRKILVDYLNGKLVWK